MVVCVVILISTFSFAPTSRWCEDSLEDSRVVSRSRLLRRRFIDFAIESLQKT